MASKTAADDLYRQAAAEYGAALERLTYAYEADADGRRDLLQEIHLQLWRSFEKFNGRCSLRTWIYRVAHNVATSHVIRQTRRKRNAPAFLTLEEAAAQAGQDNVEISADRNLARATADADSAARIRRSPGDPGLPRGSRHSVHRRNYRPLHGQHLD